MICLQLYVAALSKSPSLPALNHSPRWGSTRCFYLINCLSTAPFRLRSTIFGHDSFAIHVHFEYPTLNRAQRAKCTQKSGCCNLMPEGGGGKQQTTCAFLSGESKVADNLEIFYLSLVRVSSACFGNANVCA